VTIPKPGTNKCRRLGIATVRDRVVQAALKLVLEPMLEADFQPFSYGFRPERRAQDAIAEIHYYTSRSYEWIVEGDIRAFFYAGAHSLLMLTTVGIVDRAQFFKPCGEPLQDLQAKLFEEIRQLDPNEQPRVTIELVPSRSGGRTRTTSPSARSSAATTGQRTRGVRSVCACPWHGGGMVAILHHHRVLSEALGHAVKWQALATNPALAVDAEGRAGQYRPGLVR
jgi:hypothetical protein